jgi:hypothetical protein
MTPGVTGHDLQQPIDLLRLHHALLLRRRNLHHIGAVSNRLPDGNTDDSDDEGATYAIGDFESATQCQWLTEFKDADKDPERVRCVNELPSTHSIRLKERLSRAENELFKSFVDEMFTQLAKAYITASKQEIFIKADETTVLNINACCYAYSDRLDLNLAKRTQGYFIEPENLLTITVPTGLPSKDPHKGDDSNTYASYHRTDWSAVTKIRVEDCIRPAGWSKNERNVPNQYPCYGFFGFSTEIDDPDDLGHWAVKNCTSNLFRIGKGQLPAGLIATCRSPKISKQSAGGNDQLQRMCRLQGIAKGKDGATAMNSSCASVSYVAATQQVSPSLITRTASSCRPTTPPPDPRPGSCLIACPCFITSCSSGTINTRTSPRRNITALPSGKNIKLHPPSSGTSSGSSIRFLQLPPRRNLEWLSS